MQLWSKLELVIDCSSVVIGWFSEIVGLKNILAGAVVAMVGKVAQMDSLVSSGDRI